MRLLAFLLSYLALANAWSYSDTDAWADDYPSCGGQSQSPINIDTMGNTIEDFSNFTFSVGYKIVQKGDLTNDGHGIKFSVDESLNQARISGGPLNDSYILNQFHIHWGSEKGRGSEHTLDGEQYDAEIHLVHYNEQYDNISHALAGNESNSLAVLGIFVREVEMWDQYTEVVDPNSVIQLRMGAQMLAKPWYGPAPPDAKIEIRLIDFIASISDLTGMYHYSGSLTTPPCNEVVEWLVLDKPLLIRKSLLNALRKNVDADEKPLDNNYRPTQPLNGRSIEHFEAGHPSLFPTLRKAAST